MKRQGFGREMEAKKECGRTHQVLMASHLQRRGLSFRPFWLQVSAVTVQRHWHVVESKAHFLLRHGRQRVVGEGDGKEMVEGEILVGGSDGGEGKDVAEGTGGAWVAALVAPVIFCLDFLPLSFFLPFLAGFRKALDVGVGWRCSFNLQSHWLCSMKGSSVSSCFIKDVLISSMVTACVSVGTHSKASSAQQPPHRLTDTQDGMKRLWVSSGNSRQTSTRVSRGSQPLREYTSNHRRTSRPSLDLGESAGRQ